jgi:Predicted membrane protein (DUF2254)
MPMTGEPGTSPVEQAPSGSRWRRALRRLSDGLWFIPAVYVIPALALSVGLLRWDEADPIVLTRAISAGSASAALSALGSGMLAFTGFVTSVVLLIIQFGTSEVSISSRNTGKMLGIASLSAWDIRGMSTAPGTVADASFLVRHSASVEAAVGCKTVAYRGGAAPIPPALPSEMGDQNGSSPRPGRQSPTPEPPKRQGLASIGPVGRPLPPQRTRGSPEGARPRR